MTQLEEIKILATYVDTQIPQGLTQFPIDTAVELAADTIRLVEAIEAILALENPPRDDPDYVGYSRALIDMKWAIQQRLSEANE
jgi:hypothetical protein